MTIDPERKGAARDGAADRAEPASGVEALAAAQGSRAAPAGTLGSIAIERLAFDDALAELQRTVAELEAGGQPLETAIALYERGVALHERCSALLADAELRVRRLVERAGGALQAVEVRAEDVESPETADSTG